MDAERRVTMCSGSDGCLQFFFAGGVCEPAINQSTVYTCREENRLPLSFALVFASLGSLAEAVTSFLRFKPGIAASLLEK